MRTRHIHILVVALALTATPVASAATAAAPAATSSWYPQLHLAVLDVGDAATAIGTCEAPRAANPEAGRGCSIARASAETGELDRVSVFAETGAIFGPCRRALLKLDRTASTAAVRALTFATSPMTMEKEVSGRRALAQAAKHVTADFAALQRCLGKP